MKKIDLSKYDCRLSLHKIMAFKKGVNYYGKPHPKNVIFINITFNSDSRLNTLILSFYFDAVNNILKFNKKYWNTKKREKKNMIFDKKMFDTKENNQKMDKLIEEIIQNK